VKKLDLTFRFYDAISEARGLIDRDPNPDKSTEILDKLCIALEQLAEAFEDQRVD